MYASDEIQTHNLSRRAAGNLRLRPRGHWNRQITFNTLLYSMKCSD